MNYFTRLAQRSGSYERSRPVSSPHITGENHSADISEETNTITADSPLHNNDAMQPGVPSRNDDVMQSGISSRATDKGQTIQQNQSVKNTESHGLNHMVTEGSPLASRIPDSAGTAAESLSHFEAPRQQVNSLTLSDRSLSVGVESVVNQAKPHSGFGIAQKQILNGSKTVAMQTITTAVKNNRDTPEFKASEPVFSSDRSSTAENIQPETISSKLPPAKNFVQHVSNKVDKYEIANKNMLIDARERTSRLGDDMRPEQEIIRAYTGQQKLEINIGTIALEIHQKPAQAVSQVQAQMPAEPAPQRTEKTFQANRYYLRG